MITKFKIFESINNGEPGIGDWVICELEDIDWIEGYEKMEEIISENIGRIISYDDDDTSPYVIKYYLSGKKKQFFNDFKSKLGYGKNNIIYVEFDEIKYWSKNREDLTPENLKISIDSSKYNI